MPSYKLIYFDVKGRGEPTRYMFALAGVAYEDKRISSDEWKKLKPTLILGQMPLLEVDGKQFPQSHAIHRYVAAELGFYGKNALERLEVDVILETLRELSAHIGKLFGEKDETKKAEIKKEFVEKHVVDNLNSLEKLLKLNKGGNGWFVRNKITLADIAVFNLFSDFIPDIVGKPLDFSKHPLIKGVMGRFQAEPKISAWIKSRPKTSM